MFTASSEPAASKAESYRRLSRDLTALLAGEPDAVANLANASALVAQALPRINWCGFYLLHGDELVLGPFQGKPACIRIPLGRGVCGTAGERRQTLVVEDVGEFPGHIACDPASRSEIVVPILQDGRLRGVLDVDAPETGRFDAEDREGIEGFVRALVPLIDWDSLEKTG